MPRRLGGLPGEPQDDVHRGGARPRVRARAWQIVRGPAGARSETAPRPGDRLHGLLPRHADHHRRVLRRLRPPDCQLGFISNRSFTTYGVISLTLVYTAYVTEVYRAGIESVHPSQRAAARSLGLSYGQAMRYVIIPQAVRRVIPPLLNDFIGLQKDTAIVSVHRRRRGASLAQQFSTTKRRLRRHTVVAAAFFVLITIPLARFTDHLVAQRERASAHRRFERATANARLASSRSSGVSKWFGGLQVLRRRSISTSRSTTSSA